ncbi:hypothetical protein L1987_06638 [Smallanthus sonchifolius]|uniref:Uncharacterized protein n=1 Tax=Smallanthus sonchifolius TaxID=185202 RepID=A0ACB9JYQ2_9ASTR|nr:hypothetical protein L1987_06638 [Smallanthus sonchifolius]
MITEGTGIESRLEPSREGLGRQRLLNRKCPKRELDFWVGLASEFLVTASFRDDESDGILNLERGGLLSGSITRRELSATNRIILFVCLNDKLVEGSGLRGRGEVSDAFVGRRGAGNSPVGVFAGESLGPPDNRRGLPKLKEFRPEIRLAEVMETGKGMSIVLEWIYSPEKDLVEVTYDTDDVNSS